MNCCLSVRSALFVGLPGGKHGAMGGWPDKQLERQVGKRARTDYTSQGTAITGSVNHDQSARKKASASLPLPNLMYDLVFENFT